MSGTRRQTKGGGAGHVTALAGALMFLACSGGLAADKDEKPAVKKPKEYPEVELQEDSKPRYAAIALDSWNEGRAYLLFDGNKDKGYPRMYVWIPETRKKARSCGLSRSGCTSMAAARARVATTPRAR